MKSIKTKDYSVSQETFTLKYNVDYHLYKTEPVPENLSSYYETEDYISHTDAKESLIDKLYQLVKKITLKSKEQLLSSFVSSNNNFVLDIGCGTGSFLESLNKDKWNSVGIEPSSVARELAIKKGVSCFSNESEIENKQFDIITMWHVLEHVPDFNKQFKSFKKLLNKNGIVIIAVPNFESYDSNFYKEYWAALDVPRHLWHFSEKSISKIASEHNFILKDVKPMWFDSFYVSLLSEKYKYKKVNYLRAFSIGLISNLKSIKNGQFSSKIYILESKN